MSPTNKNNLDLFSAIQALKRWQEGIAQRAVRFVGPKSASLMLLWGLLLVVGVLVWPTPYRYERLRGKFGETVLVRINRLTGKAEEYVDGRWIAPKPERKPQPLPIGELAKLSGNAGFTGHGGFSGKLYNGTSWTITKITVRIVARGQRKELWDRRFATAIFAPPLSTGSILLNVTDDEGVVDFDWYIIDAEGYPPE
jgi:hypothetical protein